MDYTEKWRQYKSQKAGEFERARIEREKAKANKGPLGELAPLASALGAAFGLPYVGSLISGVGGVVGTVGTAMAGASDLEKLFNAYTAYTGTQQTGSIGAGLGQAALTAPLAMAEASIKTNIERELEKTFPKKYSMKEINQEKRYGVEFADTQKPGFTIKYDLDNGKTVYGKPPIDPNKLALLQLNFQAKQAGLTKAQLDLMMKELDFTQKQVAIEQDIYGLIPNQRTELLLKAVTFANQQVNKLSDLSKEDRQKTWQAFADWYTDNVLGLSTVSPEESKKWLVTPAGFNYKPKAYNGKGYIGLRSSSKVSLPEKKSFKGVILD